MLGSVGGAREATAAREAAAAAPVGTPCGGKEAAGGGAAPTPLSGAGDSDSTGAVSDGADAADDTDAATDDDEPDTGPGGAGPAPPAACVVAGDTALSGVVLWVDHYRRAMICWLRRSMAL